MHRSINNDIIYINPCTLKVLLIDVGSITDLRPNKVRIKTNLITTPPEFLDELQYKFYNYKCDIWSIGILS